MPIPDFQSVMRPILVAVADRAPLALRELCELIADEHQLSQRRTQRTLALWQANGDQ